MQRTGSGYAPKIAWGLGLRKARHNNLGAMATLNWKLSKHVDLLWIRILKGRYRSSNLPSSRPSPTWRGILKGKQLFDKGTHVRLGNGLSMSFWMEDGTLRSKICGPLQHHESTLKVRECWIHNSWNLHSTSFVFPHEILSNILNTDFQWFNNSPDSLIWNLSNNGEFTKSAISLLNNMGTNDRPWKSIWRLLCTFHIQHFVWLVVQDCLSTRHNLFLCHITPTPFCEWCPLVPERLKPLAMYSVIALVQHLFGIPSPLPSPHSFKRIIALTGFFITLRWTSGLPQGSSGTLCFSLLCGKYGWIGITAFSNIIPHQVLTLTPITPIGLHP